MGEERRITDLTAISAFRSNDYIAVDNASEAQTKKLPASAITGAISAAQTDATRALNIARSTSSFPTGDAYSSSSSYKVGDMVIYNNTLYRCKTACSPASWSVNASNFEATSLASALTDLNNDLNEALSKFKEIKTDTKSVTVSASGNAAMGFNRTKRKIIAAQMETTFTTIHGILPFENSDGSVWLHFIQSDGSPYTPAGTFTVRYWYFEP